MAKVNHVTQPRLLNRNGNYYIEIQRKRITLKTRDPVAAKRKAALIQRELEVLGAYKIIADRLFKAKEKIDNHYKQIEHLIGVHEDFFNNSCNSRNLEKEEEFQAAALPVLIEKFNLELVGTFVECHSGIPDAICISGKTKIVVEFKRQSIGEEHLGQCLRYLNDKAIGAEYLWLVGKKEGRGISVFKDFPKIVPVIARREKKVTFSFRACFEDQKDRLAAATASARNDPAPKKIISRAFADSGQIQNISNQKKSDAYDVVNV